MKTRNLPLIVGITLPIVLIIIVAIVIFVPSLSIKPQYNFIYTTASSYYSYNQDYRNTYSVNGTQIVLEPNPAPTDLLAEKIVYRGDAPELYIYDTKTDSSHKITFEEAKKLKLDPGPSSPDGYTVSYRYGNNGIFDMFGSGNSNYGYFISKGDGSKKLMGMSDDRYWGREDFKLIGWII